MSTTLSGSTIIDAVRAVRPGRVDPDPGTVFAAGAWTTLTEPGEALAGAVIGALGAAEALEAVRLGVPPNPRREVVEGIARWRRRLDPELVLYAFHDAARSHVRLLVPGDADWPVGLDDLGPEAPAALWVLAPDGPVPDLRRSISLVGTRTPTEYGHQAAQDLSCGVVDRGYAVISGAAYGIDGICHRGALASGGLTAAVLAGGLDRFYPSEHADLLARIAATGAVLSEMPCGAAPSRHRFLRRNRLIAAIGRATVVVEAAHRSGAVNTAKHAADLARPLGVVPGSVYSATSAGCHRVLREYGATVVRHAADAVELASDLLEPTLLDAIQDDPLERRVREALRRSPQSIEDLARRTGLGAGEVMSALGMLSLTGAAVDTGSGWRRG